MNSSDQNFNNRNTTFKKNIYGTSKGLVREAVLMRDLKEYLDLKGPLKILDVGGGQGQIALQLAELGHEVTVTDISTEMLNVGRLAAKDKQLTNIEFYELDLKNLREQLNGHFDLVLCHAVFEWLSDPRSAFSVLKDMCTNSGAISFMFYNHVGQTLSNLIYANFDYIKAGMKAKKVVKLNPQSALHPDQVLNWIEEEGLSITIKSGVRVFHDYIRDLEKWQSDTANIIEMELTYSRQAPYTDIGRYMHLILENKGYKVNL
ncbi:methyltransferase domain-containing protein [Psychrosphaera aestuarii]|uniref:methyltransferase domain-containing protein n=1 Tax=Psychrosphaera aestuarii TaxID=1266052 RepID=UPI001B33FC58|nr:methyltransferase domain-containing protein [Psychrosphaera aestuarii]